MVFLTFLWLSFFQISLRNPRPGARSWSLTVRMCHRGLGTRFLTVRMCHRGLGTRFLTMRMSRRGRGSGFLTVSDRVPRPRRDFPLAGLRLRRGPRAARVLRASRRRHRRRRPPSCRACDPAGTAARSCSGPAVCRRPSAPEPGRG